MKTSLLLRLYVLLFLFSLVWVFLGSPIWPDEWQNISAHLTLLFHQLPVRMAYVFTAWH